jgi:hypothetical protein
VKDVTERVPDPEDVSELPKEDLMEVEVDETPDEERPQPLEADPADVAEQRRVEDLDDDLYADPDA